jgi:hypothetical protein
MDSNFPIMNKLKFLNNLEVYFFTYAYWQQQKCFQRRESRSSLCFNFEMATDPVGRIAPSIVHDRSPRMRRANWMSCQIVRGIAIKMVSGNNQ